MNRRLTIGYDAKRIVKNGTGLGSYGRTLINDLSANSSLNLRLYAPDKGRNDLRGQIVTRDNLQFCYPKRSGIPFEKAFWRSKGIVKDLVKDGVQIYHGLSGELPFGISRSGVRSIVTIHDLIFLRHPEFYNWIDTKIYAWKFFQTIREADHIIAISECTKRDIIEFGNIEDSEISVVYQSYSPSFRRQVYDKESSSLPERYILNVGSIEARKNVLLAVKAMHYLPEELHLVIVGRHTKYTDKVSEYVRSHQLEHRVHILHGVSNDLLPAIYAGAESFVYPSVYEGFGIPIIEAISSGLPVVACTGSCLEEAGGPSSIYVDPDDERAMANAITMTLRGAEGRQQRIERSQEYIRRFEGRDVASQIVDLYNRLI
jgi:glycosyltransferase involved in cell wall biosynthesis